MLPYIRITIVIIMLIGIAKNTEVSVKYRNFSKLLKFEYFLVSRRKTQDFRGTFSENLESWVLGPGNTEISVKYCNFSISWSQDARLKISGGTFSEKLESWDLGPGNTEISVKY